MKTISIDIYDYLNIIRPQLYNITTSYKTEDIWLNLNNVSKQNPLYLAKYSFHKLIKAYVDFIGIDYIKSCTEDPIDFGYTNGMQTCINITNVLIHSDLDNNSKIKSLKPELLNKHVNNINLCYNNFIKSLRVCTHKKAKWPVKNINSDEIQAILSPNTVDKITNITKEKAIELFNTVYKNKNYALVITDSDNNIIQYVYDGNIYKFVPHTKDKSSKIFRNIKLLETLYTIELQIDKNKYIPILDNLEIVNSIYLALNNMLTHIQKDRYIILFENSRVDTYTFYKIHVNTINKPRNDSNINLNSYIIKDNIYDYSYSKLHLLIDMIINRLDTIIKYISHSTDIDSCKELLSFISILKEKIFETGNHIIKKLYINYINYNLNIIIKNIYDYVILNRNVTQADISKINYNKRILFKFYNIIKNSNLNI